ncbi:uncharacterized protein C8Q71DRAFT_782580 [Rhodofomes roseus]|uniref:Uncharacterized protein n=1 Tax=Rhodofomes roseus TaxID=34475 RepID=A0ABQ8K3L8_9APHY|nr:uncharacterized protein C8Q71DRAFT_782580 [Rhodofomes roseus]KAH9831442.1 hypothetical protein C8Q71DRAFT_782580 [Rhodofomes roseus]
MHRKRTDGWLIVLLEKDALSLALSVFQSVRTTMGRGPRRNPESCMKQIRISIIGEPPTRQAVCVDVNRSRVSSYVPRSFRHFYRELPIYIESVQSLSHPKNAEGSGP